MFLLLYCRLVVAARFIRVLLFIRIVTGKDQVERATRRMVKKDHKFLEFAIPTSQELTHKVVVRV